MESIDPKKLFPSEWIDEDHYNGIHIHLDRCTGSDLPGEGLDRNTFAIWLRNSLLEWTAQQRRGLWLYVPHQHADKIDIAVRAGFEFHQVLSSEPSPPPVQQINHREEPHQQEEPRQQHRAQGCLILTKWLPTSVNKLPRAPHHQVGVGCLIFHPHDPSQMLVVQEKTGPAAAFQLWKMPTGLTDPGEDIHHAAIRELREETGMVATFRGILQFRQAHPSITSGGGGGGGASGEKSLRRSCSDLFFVCVLDVPTATIGPCCPDEIAAIRWMSVQEYCDQERWQTSPIYMELNRVIQQASDTAFHSSIPRQQQQQQFLKTETPLLIPQTLLLGFGRGTNTVYHAYPKPFNDPSNDSHL